MQKQRGWINFGICSLNGILYRTDNKIENVANAEWFKSALKGNYVLTEPALSSSGTKYTCTAAIPIRDLQGKIVGAISLTLLGDSLSNLISDIIVGETGTAYLISSQGTVLGNRRPEILYKSIFTEILGSDKTAFALHLKKSVEQPQTHRIHRRHRRRKTYCGFRFHAVHRLDIAYKRTGFRIYRPKHIEAGKYLYCYRISTIDCSYRFRIFYSKTYYQAH